MALFLEVHEVGGRTVWEVARTHAADLRTRRAPGVRYLRHWFSDASGRVVCLVEAPDASALRAIHADSQALLIRELTGTLGPIAPADDGG